MENRIGALGWARMYAASGADRYHQARLENSPTVALEFTYVARFRDDCVGRASKSCVAVDDAGKGDRDDGTDPVDG
jgi:hypothetical protein